MDAIRGGDRTLQQAVLGCKRLLVRIPGINHGGGLQPGTETFARQMAASLDAPVFNRLVSRMRIATAAHTSLWFDAWPMNGDTSVGVTVLAYCTCAVYGARIAGMPRRRPLREMYSDAATIRGREGAVRAVAPS